jgi:hypothetical protein
MRSTNPAVRLWKTLPLIAPMPGDSLLAGSLTVGTAVDGPGRSFGPES